MGRTARLRKRRVTAPSGTDFSHLCCWLLSSGWKPTAKLKPTYFHRMGWGLRTKKKLYSGDYLVRIPHHLLITESVARNSDLAPLLDDSLKPEYVLALYILWEKLKGNESFWFAYIKSLPVQFDLPLFCSSAEYEILPDFVKKKVLQQLDSCAAVFDCFKNKLGELSSGTVDYSTICFRDFVWAWAVVNTRCVIVDESHTVAVVPYMDLFNHSNTCNFRTTWNSNTNTFDIVTLDSYRKNSQVFIRYGAHSNLDLLSEYGFVMSRNIHDIVPIEWEELLSVMRKSCSMPWDTSPIRFKFLKSHGFLNGLGIHYEGLTYNTLVVIYILITKDRRFEQKIFSNSFQDEAKEVLCDVSKALIFSKLNHLENILGTMEKLNTKCTKSFEMTKSLILEFIRLLKKSAQLIEH